MNTILINDTFNKIIQIKPQLVCSQTTPLHSKETAATKEQLKMVSKNIEKEFPYFSKRIDSLIDILFIGSNDSFGVDPFVFGEILEILSTLNNIHSFDYWSLIHPRISMVSKSLYLDGHFADASLKAFVAINQRMKEIHKIQCPQEDELDGVALMNTMFSDKNPKIEICSRDTETGKNIHMGTRFMLACAMSALRNPQAREIIKLSPDDAMRRLMFASMLMFKINEAVEYSNIQEK